nr:hypothetical protein [Eubacterium sp.]
MLIRVLPEKCFIEVKGDMWFVRGDSDLSIEAFLECLVSKGIEVLAKDDISSRVYLLNQGIEMLIDEKNDMIQCIQFRLCLSWINTGLKELHDILMCVSQRYVLYDWMNNSEGLLIGKSDEFVQRHMSLNQDKIEIFEKWFSEDEEVRLIEGEVQEYIRKRKRKWFKFKRMFKGYTRLYGGRHEKSNILG